MAEETLAVVTGITGIMYEVHLVIQTIADEMYLFVMKIRTVNA